MKQFGARAQKLTIDAGFTCPNRDSTKGLNGCTYCDNDAFNPSYCTPQKSVQQQIGEGIEFHRNRYRRAAYYLAYFQAYSNTYASLKQLKEIYQPALEHPQIAGIVVGTRPDCLEDEKLDFFAELSQKMFVSIEIGIESIHDETLHKINRGHDFQCAVDALQRIKARNLHAGAHFIFGLPDETLEMWLEDVRIINNLPLDSIKFHQLQIIKGTQMEKEYLENPQSFYPFTMDNYITFIVDFVERLNPAFAIERFAGEVPPRYLTVNNWGTIRYDIVLQRIIREFEKRKSWQGKKLLTS
ncbi:MAG: TIGR01212 family radical SAM protein [Lentimicrobiaceae bacterium]|nr:TIGR01212 family radical SAM protein [Lentimicrobiaceae bacterium]